MKFALILESSVQQSYSVRNKCAFKYGTNEIYEWHSSIRVGNEMTSMGPFAYPFIFRSFASGIMAKHKILKKNHMINPLP